MGIREEHPELAAEMDAIDDYAFARHGERLTIHECVYANWAVKRGVPLDVWLDDLFGAPSDS